jgi:hypothetical protein
MPASAYTRQAASTSSASPSDAAWLSYGTTGQTRVSADLRAVHAGLLAQTYRRA